MKRDWVFVGVMAIVVVAAAAPSLVPVIPPRPLAVPLAVTIPGRVNAWQAQPSPPVVRPSRPETCRRVYVREGGDEVTLYFPGGVPHSPGLPLPGGDWETRTGEIVRLRTNGGSVAVNLNLAYPPSGSPGVRPVIIVYWYQERGRIIARESWAKLYRVWDSLRQRRVEGALVSISTEVVDERQARKRAIDFAEEILPFISAALPFVEGKH
jgi:EpsI family protein